jgi:hypothetical protein
MRPDIAIAGEAFLVGRCIAKTLRTLEALQRPVCVCRTSKVKKRVLKMKKVMK